jgi:hypothetical protein
MMQADGSTSTTPPLPPLPIALLTRDAHATGRWLTDLQCALEARGARVELQPLSLFDRTAGAGGARRWRCLVTACRTRRRPPSSSAASRRLRAAKRISRPSASRVRMSSRFGALE